ncbi:MAG TPA: phosphoribosylformylglycinamidine synthase [Candidatus Latescibacteria bacterium]|nr:phosphoribosylformylglycinamidine synthase [Candidatus Latescibacterota bacterium]
MSLLHLFRSPFLSSAQVRDLISKASSVGLPVIRSLQTESCFNIQTSAPLSHDEMELLSWLLRETFEPACFGPESFLSREGQVLEVGPRMNFSTAWSTNAVSICRACGLSKVERIERSRRYLLTTESDFDKQQTKAFLNLVHDRMTECLYPQALTSFASGVTPEATFDIPLIEEGMAALSRINKEMGLAFDDWDLEYYTDLFLDHIKRNPTNVECFDIAQSNSEHSRHWFFKGRLIVDGTEISNHLMEMIQEPLKRNPANSVIAFRDNSSAIRGYRIKTMLPQSPGQPSPLHLAEKDYHALFTAETHNFPSGVAPFPGAETGTGGRIRDVHATGRGSLVVAGTAAYCVGNLRIPGYELPWEDRAFKYPPNLASPLQIEIEASNGASDYGNKFGEPLIQGYTRAFGLRLPGGERREWIKPIMFSGGIGQIDATHTEKFHPEKDMYVVKLGGPAYRIGMGGGAASSMVQGENIAELDFNAVQRGDAEMEQKVNRVIRACVELGDANPIVSIHDQGAGGSCNVLKEIVEPGGAKINVRAIPVGDSSLSVLEIWGAEYQEQDALLLRPEHTQLFASLCEREKVQCAFVGRITGDGRIVLYDDADDATLVDLDLDKVLGDMPQKTFELDRSTPSLEPVVLPQGITVKAALGRVLRLVSVGSKRFLTNKVDRSVTGLVARQQCVGPLQLPTADVAVIAQSHFGLTGVATAIGEQPIIGLIEPAAMARMSLGEALTNLVWAQVSGLEDVKCSGNWMWAAKLPGEGAALYDAADALCKMLIQLGVAIDGGKDSLSMAALVPGPQGADETVKAPGALVISAYVTCPDVTKTVTPDLKLGDEGRMLFVDLGCGNLRLGGSALAQVYNQVGQEAPDVNDPERLKRAFGVTQSLISQGLVSAGHDRSDGGLITTILEMAFSGNCGIEINLQDPDLTDPVRMLFTEELGLVLEVRKDVEQRVLKAFSVAQVPCVTIGNAIQETDVIIRLNGVSVLEGDTREFRDMWEETSFHLESLQANPQCVEQEREGLRKRSAPAYLVPYKPRPTQPSLLDRVDKPRVAIVREEGSNGDREMASAFHSAGFEAWDISMSDLLKGSVSLDSFRGMVFVGGFSYADVLDSAKGWAGVIRFNEGLWQQFQGFYTRPDTFSLGVCNGCQLMALLGWVPWQGIADDLQPRFIHNSSGRFESRFSTVQVQKSPAIMFDGMAGATLGIWVAHGEGRAYFPDSETLTRILDDDLAPVRYVDDQAGITESYPFNPNGSPEGIASLCSPDGRHLAMMPHPERVFLKWQWGWMPQNWKSDMEASPWLRMFQNARKWCEAYR